MDYRVQLDIFNGPLDLLLYLIRRDELDILDIPIARITQSYVEYIEQMRQLQSEHGIDIDSIGDFLVMAATLMEIKSGLLLPTPPPLTPDGTPTAAEQLADPRSDLIKQLLEYKRFKDHSAALEAQQRTHAERFPRKPVLREVAADQTPPLDLDEVQVWDLLSAFTRLMGEIGQRDRIQEIVDDDTPQDLHMTDIEDRLRHDGALTLRQLLCDRRSRGELIGVFLAVLELVRQKRVVTMMSAGGDQIVLEIAPDDHRATFRGAMHIAPD